VNAYDLRGGITIHTLRSPGLRRQDKRVAGADDRYGAVTGNDAVLVNDQPNELVLLLLQAANDLEAYSAILIDD
jgi:hypothetical protein